MAARAELHVRLNAAESDFRFDVGLASHHGTVHIGNPDFVGTRSQEDAAGILEVVDCFLLVDTAQTPDSSVRLIATLRADYFDRPLAYPGFDDAIHGRTVALGAMSPQELADAVRLPACAVGVQIEPAVVDRIVAEAELQPGALPLVQHTLSELFETRTTNTITVASTFLRRTMPP